VHCVEVFRSVHAVFPVQTTKQSVSSHQHQYILCFVTAMTRTRDHHRCVKPTGSRRVVSENNEDVLLLLFVKRKGRERERLHEQASERRVTS
jgi:hypothetical protein